MFWCERSGAPLTVKVPDQIIVASISTCVERQNQ